MAGVDIVHVPYRGSAPALTDLLAGRVQTLFDNIPGAVGQIKAGKVRALGVTAPQRVPALPDVPAMAETVPGYEASVWYGIAVPRGTPPEVVAKLNEGVNAVLANPKLKARMQELGGDPMPMTPDAFGKLVSDETQKWAKVIRGANIHLE
jgi:tripartite-type tricarboxylate transporter receptor subunit TctC